MRVPAVCMWTVCMPTGSPEARATGRYGRFTEGAGTKLQSLREQQVLLVLKPFL